MLGRPRCREWSPLATQQLRLRSLLQIVGYNIYGNECCSQPGSLYYTLHSTTMSAPFYTSEKLLSNHPKWREIDSEIIHKMSSPSIVVRVWRHIRYEQRISTEHETDQHKQTDKIIQTWYVSFSGLLHIGANLSLHYTPKSFNENTLIFQMAGGYFCSYDKIRFQPTMRILNSTINTVKGREIPSSRIMPIDNRQYRGFKESKSVSPSKGSWRSEGLDGKISKSHSPPTHSNLRQSLTHDRFLSNLNRIPDDSYRERGYYDAHSDSVYEHSPRSDTCLEIREYSGSEGSNDNLKSSGSLSASNRDLTSVEESETAETYDENIKPLPKYKFSHMKFLKSEIRPSYNSEKLQKLHLLQYLIKKRFQAVQEIKEKIYEKSAMENCENLSPTQSLCDYEDFSRSEDLSVSSREFSLISGKGLHGKSRDLKSIFNEDTEEEQIKIDNKTSKVKAVENKIQKVAEKSHRSTEYKPYANRKQSFYTLVNNTEATDRRFTLPLNKLLKFKTQPSPSQRLKYASLTKQLELSRFKKRLLNDERDSALINIRRLREINTKLLDENQDKGSDLMQKYHSLSRKWEQLKELRKSESALKELCVRSSSLLQTRRWHLVQDIQFIYPITEKDGKLYVLDIHLPACQHDADGLRQVPEAALAVALGRVAHISALAAALLAIPLRHPLRLMGSRTKVLDHLSQQKREIPLFAHNKDSVMFRYGLFLLNRNISQLLWASHRVITPDPRDTLGNLRKLITPPILNTNMESSHVYGSVSSVETTGAGGYGLVHPFSAPALTAENLNQLQKLVCSNSNSIVNTGAIRKVSHHSLRSLVAVSADRSNRSIIASGGFNNTGRQFNRFKDSVDGHSPKDAMRIRRHRYSRSVGSCIDDQAMETLELSASSIIGSEPSLLMQDLQCEKKDNASNSPSENIHNMSFSESDLTKVSDITSPETASSINGYSAVNEGKVLFSVGDDIHLDGDGEETNVKQVYAENTRSAIGNEIPKMHLTKENVEIKNLQVDLSDELKQMCYDYTSDNVNIDDLRLMDSACDIVSDKFNENSSLSCKSDVTCCNDSICVNLTTVPTKSFDNCDIIDKLPTEKMNDDEISILTCNPNTCKVIDIEKIDLSYCDEPCAANCPLVFERFTASDGSAKIPDDTGNLNDSMHDVIVLPSAEAVLTSSSHFTESLDLPGGFNSASNFDESRDHQLDSGIDIESDQKDQNLVYFNVSEPTCDSDTTDKCNLVAAEFDENSDVITNTDNQSDDDTSHSCDVQISDSVLIYEGNNASRDANELLESLKLIESAEVLPKDIKLGTILNTVIEDVNNLECKEDVPSDCRTVADENDRPSVKEFR